MTEFPPVCCAECGTFAVGDHYRVAEDGTIFRWNGRSWEPAARTYCPKCNRSVDLAPSIERNPSVLAHFGRVTNAT